MYYRVSSQRKEFAARCRCCYRPASPQRAVAWGQHEVRQHAGDDGSGSNARLTGTGLHLSYGSTHPPEECPSLPHVCAVPPLCQTLTWITAASGSRYDRTRQSSCHGMHVCPPSLNASPLPCPGSASSWSWSSHAAPHMIGRDV